MKKLERVLLIILLAALVGRLCGLLWCRGFFTSAAWVLSIVYLVWGYRLLRTSERTPLWLAVAAGIALATSIAILPFLTFVRHDLVFLLLPIPNFLLFAFLLGRYLQNRKQQRAPFAEGAILVRSIVLLVSVSFLVYMPPVAPYRAVIRALNNGDEKLVANMDMIAASKAYENAMIKGDLALALTHAQQAYHHGRIWLYGNAELEILHYPVGDSAGLDHEARMRRYELLLKHGISIDEDQLWKIGETLNNLYEVHHWLGAHAEEVGDAALAFTHYRTGDSLFNLIERSEVGAAKERVWSKRSMARAASGMGEYDVADSLFSKALDLYKESVDTVDAGCGWVLSDWSRSLAKRRQWEHANYLLRVAIGLSERDTASDELKEQWFDHRLRLAKNLMNTDSLDLAERVLRPCLAYTPADSLLRCEVLVVQGSLQFRQNVFRAADSTFAAAIACAEATPNAEHLLQLAHLSRGYTCLALAEYDRALEMVDVGVALGSGKRMYPTALPSLKRLRAAVHHQQGRYADALNEYEACVHDLRTAASDDLPLALSSMADVLLDLAQPHRAMPIAEEALAQLADTITELLPGQTPTLNTAAYADYHLGHLDQAADRYAYTLDVCTRFGTMHSSTYAQALNGLALVEMARSHLAQADTLFERAHRSSVAIHGQEHPFTARVSINQAELRIKQRRYDDAKRLLLVARPITIRSLGKDHDQLADIEQLLGDLAARSGGATQATAHYAEALRIYLHCFPEAHPKVQVMRGRL